MEQQESGSQETTDHQHSNSRLGAARYVSAGQRFLNCIIDLIFFYGVAFGIAIMLIIAYDVSGERPDSDNPGFFRKHFS